jgi:hypothetical protein
MLWSPSHVFILAVEYPDFVPYPKILFDNIDPGG